MTTFKDFRSEFLQDETILDLEKAGYIECNVPRRFLHILDLEHVWVNDKLYCPVWIQIVYNANKEDMLALYRQLSEIRQDTQLQVVVVSEMLLSPEYADIADVLRTFVERARRGL